MIKKILLFLLLLIVLLTTYCSYQKKVAEVFANLQQDNQALIS